MDTNRYPAQVFWSDDDEGYIAIAPDLPGCSAFGEDQQEALAELQHAIAAWIEAANAVGNPVPAPSKPAERITHSGKVLVRMPRELHAGLAKSAESEGISLNQYVVYLLAKYHTERSTLIKGAQKAMEHWHELTFASTWNQRGATNASIAATLINAIGRSKQVEAVTTYQQLATFQPTQQRA